MLTPIQRKIRRSMVTATNAVVICGFSPSKARTLLTEWREKVEELDTSADAFDHDDDEGKIEPFAVKSGHHNEPLIVSALADERGLLVAPGETIRHPSESWIGATPDGFAVAPPEKPILARHIRRALPKLRKLAVIEAKAVGYHRVSHWRDEAWEWCVPTYVWAQVQWQMLAARLPYAFVGMMAGTSYRSFVIEHSDDLACAMLEACDHFWRSYVVPRVMPPVDGSKAAWELLRKRFPRAGASLVDVHDDTVAEMLRLRALKDEIKALEEEHDTLAQRLAEQVGDAQGLRGEVDSEHEIHVTWSERKGYHVAAFDVAPTRQLRVTVKDKPGLAKARPRTQKKEVAA